MNNYYWSKKHNQLIEFNEITRRSVLFFPRRKKVSSRIRLTSDMLDLKTAKETISFLETKCEFLIQQKNKIIEVKRQYLSTPKVPVRLNNDRIVEFYHNGKIVHVLSAEENFNTVPIYTTGNPFVELCPVDHSIKLRLLDGSVVFGNNETSFLWRFRQEFLEKLEKNFNGIYQELLKYRKIKTILEEINL